MKRQLLEPKNLPFETEMANAILISVYECNWFSNVGQNHLRDVARVKSWEEAIEMAADQTDLSFSNYVNAIANFTRSLAASVDRNIYNKYWSKACNVAAKPLMPFLKKQVFPKIPMEPFSNPIASTISGGFIDAIALALLYQRSLELGDLFNEYYLNGYFPCGFTGTFPSGYIDSMPDGKLIVY